MPRKPPEAAAEVLRAFEEHLRLEAELGEVTVARYLRWLRRWLAFLALRERPWLSATRDDALEWKVELGRTDRYHADALRHALVMGRHLYEWAEDRGWFEGKNPFAKIRAPHTWRTVKLALSQAQIDRLFDQHWPADFRWLRARAIVALLYGCGLRRNEVRMLDFSDVDLDQGLVAVRHSKGGYGNDVMPMPPYVAQALRAWLVAGRPLVAARGERALFVGRRGRRIDPTVLAADVALAAARLGRRVTPHDLRRSAGRHLLEAGADIATVQRFLRHRDLKTTTWYVGASAHYLSRVVLERHPLSHRHLDGPSPGALLRAFGSTDGRLPGPCESGPYPENGNGGELA